MHTIPVRPFAVLKLTTLAALALALLLLSGCNWAGERGNGTIITDTREISAFTEIEADGAFDITWTTGEPAFSVTTDENLVEHIRTRVEGDALTLSWAKPLKGTRGIKVRIASSSLRRVTLNGAVRLKTSNLAGAEFYLEANGATRVGLEGTVNALSAEMNGASRLDAQKLVTRATELAINGAGRAEVHATEVLKVDISGAGKVVYGGEPKTIDKQISGAGSVKRLD
jgi:hypothetical protein